MKDPKTAKEGERKIPLLPKNSNRRTLKKHRGEIDALVAKLLEGNAKSTIPGFLEKPTKDNVVVIQTEIGLKVGEKRRLTGSSE